MKFFFTFFLITVLALPICIDSIRDGNFISIDEAPFFAALTDENNWFYCGATIISENWLLTAAHCINYDGLGSKFVYSGGSSFKNINGNQKRNIHQVEKHFIYSDYYIDEITLNHDIALIKLKQPISFNQYQQPIKLHRNHPKDGDVVTVYGIGNQGNARDGSPVIKKTSVKYMNEEICKTTQNDVFCAFTNETDSCGGDSGGPAIIDEQLAGIVSAGPNCVVIDKTDSFPPGIYTRVDYFYDWITTVTGEQL